MSRSGLVLRIIIGLILVLAGTAKLYSLLFAGTTASILGLPKELLLAAGSFEILLGTWNLSGRFQAKAWVANILCFGCFLIIAHLESVSAIGSCGCLGGMQVPPLAMLLLDSAILIALVLVWPAQISHLQGASHKSFSLSKSRLDATCSVACILAIVGLDLQTYWWSVPVENSLQAESGAEGYLPSASLRAESLRSIPSREELPSIVRPL